MKDAVKVGPRERFTAKGKSERGRHGFRLDEVDATAAGLRAHGSTRPWSAGPTSWRTFGGRSSGASRSAAAASSCCSGPAGIGKSRLARELAVASRGDARASRRPLPPVRRRDHVLAARRARPRPRRHRGRGRRLGERRRRRSAGARASSRPRSASRPLVAPSDEVFWACQAPARGARPSAAAARLPRGSPLGRADDARPRRVPRRVRDRADRRSCATHDLSCSRRGRLGAPPARRARPSLRRRDDGARRCARDRRRRSPAPDRGDRRGQSALRRAARGDGRRRGHRPAIASSLPASIQALLAARLDSLDPDERRTLERASVVGKEFWHRAVADLSSPRRPAARRRPAVSLARKGLSRPSRRRARRGHVPLPPCVDPGRCIRGHAEDRASGAPRALRRWLRAQTAEVFGEHDEIVGYHAEQAHATAPSSDRRTTRGRSGGAGSRTARCGWASRVCAGRHAAAVGSVRACLAMVRRRRSTRERPSPSLAARRSERASGIARERSRRGDRRPRNASETAGRSFARRSSSSGSARTPKPDVRRDEDRRVAEAVIPELEQIDDDLGLAKAWWLLSEAHVIACRWGARADALETGDPPCTASPPTKDSSGPRRAYAQAPATTARRPCRTQFAGAPSCSPRRRAPTFEAGLATTLAGLRAMEGRFDEARELYADSVAVYEEFGLRFRRAVRSIVGAQIETLAGDLEAAERELRTGYAMLEEMGERGVRSTLAGFLAECSRPQGQRRRGGAIRAIARETAAETDVVPQVLWRRALARTTSRRGQPPSPRSSRARRSSSPWNPTSSTFERARSSSSGCSRVTRARTQKRQPPREARALYELEGERRAGRIAEAARRVCRVTFPSARHRRTITDPEGGGRWQNTTRGRYIGRAERDGATGPVAQERDLGRVRGGDRQRRPRTSGTAWTGR